MNNDEQLLWQAQKLDPAALHALHQRFYGSVVRYIQFKVGDIHTVEDLSGEVFVRVLEALKRGRGWQDSPQGWIMGIARHVVADYYRKRERLTEVKLNEQLMAGEEMSPFQLGSCRVNRSGTSWPLSNNLTDEQRDVILMRFMEGINIQGVATALNKTPGAVKGLQYRALRDLSGDHATGFNVRIHTGWGR